MQLGRGRILTPGGWIEGRLRYGERIEAIDSETLSGAQPYILPGFIDLHVHGAAGADIMQGGGAAAKVAQVHARHGTTAMLGTTLTACIPDIEPALRGLAKVIAERPRHGARVLGVHLEGPYLSRERLGAQPPAVIPATLEQVQVLHAIAPLRALTLAPEVTGHLDLIPALVAMGIRVQIGHTNGSYDQGVAALRAGASGFTHLFNGMSSFNHYQAGMVGAALGHAEYAELIPDLQHVTRGAIHTALRAIPKLYGVTDATSATGMPDGEYALGSQTVLKCGACVRLATGSLAGSVLTMDQALRNFRGLGLELADCAHRLSLYPADYLGETERGRLAPGAHADFVVFDAELRLQAVVIAGQSIPLHDEDQP